MNKTNQPCLIDESTGLDRELLQVRSVGVCSYVLRDGEELYLIDGGFPTIRFVERALRKKGWDHLPVTGILVTHGHLDHIVNVKKLAERYGAWIAAPSLDSLHYRGKPVYEGKAKVTGILESIGRPLLGFRSFTPDKTLDDGDKLDAWGGLTVIHLPGHTRGHSGFYSESQKLLFCGDLFASFGRWSHFPPAIFNDNSDQIAACTERALSLDLEGIWPNHADRAQPQTHLARLRRLSGR